MELGDLSKPHELNKTARENKNKMAVLAVIVFVSTFIFGLVVLGILAIS